MDPALYRLIQETNPVLIIVTNMNVESAERVITLINKLPSRALIIDIVPDTILMRSLVKGGLPCNQWVIRNRVRLYKALPRNAKVITWDPACEGIGSLIARISTYLAGGYEMRQVLAVLSLVLPVIPFIMLMPNNPSISLILIAITLSIGLSDFSWVIYLLSPG